MANPKHNRSLKAFSAASTTVLLSLLVLSTYTLKELRPSLEQIVQQNVKRDMLRFASSPFFKKVQQCSTSYFQEVLPQGFALQTHTVTTQDGYILSLYRIQKGPTFQTGLPVVFLQHGINDSGQCWFENSESLALGSMLVNAGFDVFVGNSRGSKFSRSHKSLDPQKTTFWEFSFMQMGQYDVPANLEAIRTITGVNKVAYVGHSQGTTQLFAALSDPVTRPFVAPYLTSFHALAPVVYFKNNEVPIINLVKWIEDEIQKVVNKFGINYFELGSCVFDEKTIEKWDKRCGRTPLLCYDKLFFSDKYMNPINWKHFGYKVEFSPAGTSTDSLLHYAQLLKGPKDIPVFQKFDYGSAKLNIDHYGQDKPPAYDLSLIQEKVRLWHGTGDRFADLKDVALLEKALVNAQLETHLIDRWGHIAFIMAKNANEIYGQLVQELIQETKEQTFDGNF